MSAKGAIHTSLGQRPIGANLFVILGPQRPSSGVLFSKPTTRLSMVTKDSSCGAVKVVVWPTG